MLTDRQMDAALEIFQRRMQSVTDFYYQRMGEHIRQIGQLAPSDVHRLQQLRRMDANLRDVKRRLAQAAGLNLKDLDTVLQEAAKVDDRVAKKILGVSDASVALRNNTPLQRALRAQYAETAGRLNNLSNTTVVRDAYRKAVDAAVTAVQSGAEDYESAIRRTLRRAGEMGLRVRDSGTRAAEYRSGHTRRVDSAVRMNVLDAMRRMNQQAMREVGEQFGADGVEIDAHMLCAEDHLPYQGQQFSNEEFQQIQDSLDRPFGEWNCHHTWHPILMGISPPAYAPEQLDAFERYSTEKVEIDGVARTRYEWSQAMRRMETAIREKKDTATLAKAAGDESLRRECQGQIVALNRHYESLANKVGIDPEFQRTYVPGFRDVKLEQGKASGLTAAGHSGTMSTRTETPPLRSMTNEEVRKWYLAADEKIPDQIDRNQSLEDQARQACDLRNQNRTMARELMADQATRKQLDQVSPNKSFEELLADKMERKHLTREQAIEDILRTATKTNPEINKKFGLEGEQ